MESGEAVDLKGQKNRALLLYLARSPQKTRSRDQLIGLLWAEKPEDRARHSLREAVRVLRQLLGQEGLNSDGDLIRLSDDSIHLDIYEFETHESDNDWASASELVRGEYLEGLKVKDSWQFEEWLSNERSFWRNRSIDVLTKHCEDLLATGRMGDAVSIANRAFAIDQGSASTVRSVMKSLALAGDRTEALKRFGVYVRRLSEHGAEPDEATRRLADQVKKERVWDLPSTVPKDGNEGAECRRFPLAGRCDELSQLNNVWDRCVNARTASVGFIVGDSGCGKTRLAEELVARARLSGAVVATFRAVEGDLNSDHTGIVGLARGGLLEGAGLAAASPEALSAFSGLIVEWADRFGVPQSKAQSIEEAFVEVVRAVSIEQPVFLLVDDAHWCDRNSLLTYGTVLRDLSDSPVLLCVTASQHPARGELDELRSRVGRGFQGTTVTLEALNSAELFELAKWALPSYSEDQQKRLTRRLIADSAGLPLLAVELLHAVALGMDIDATKGAWPRPLKTLSQTLPGDLPDAIVGAIRVGFRRLSGPAQNILATAAVLGRRTTAELLGECADIGGSELDTALDELEWQRWLTSDASGYSFLAEIMLQVIDRDMVTSGQRRRILRRAATHESTAKRV